MKKISYAVIGSGKHALNVFIPAIEESYNSKLVAISKSNFLEISKGTNSTILSRVLKCPILEVADILMNDSIDAVYIATPNSGHGDLVRRALKANKNVLCEKPLAFLDTDIKLIQDSLTRSKFLLCTGFMYRLHPQFKILKELLRESEIDSISAVFSYELNLSDYNIRSDSAKGGGALLDVGCYLLDMIRFILEPDDLTYEISSLTLDGSRDAEIRIAGEGIAKNQKININLFASQKSERNQYLEIRTRDKVMTLDTPFLVPRYKKCRITVNNVGAKTETIFIPPFNQVLAQLNLFSESIRKGHLFSPLSSGLLNAKDLSDLHATILASRQIDSI